MYRAVALFFIILSLKIYIYRYNESRISQRRVWPPLLLSFVFLLRDQSEGLPAARASNTERLLGRSVSIDHSLIGLRSVGGEDRLVFNITNSEKSQERIRFDVSLFFRGYRHRF